jgi:predicted RNA-binding Zn-ribbon protein involved in translation (DUF1610 family)
MTSPVTTVQVRCPQCGNLYEDWYRAPLNLTLDDFDDEYVQEATTATCPTCGTVVHFPSLIVDVEGVWHLPTSKDDRSDTD